MDTSFRAINYSEELESLIDYNSLLRQLKLKEGLNNCIHREDKSPSCSVFSKSNRYLYFDHSEKKFYSLIDLAISGGIEPSMTKEGSTISKTNNYEVYLDFWNDSNIAYWNKFSISIETLIYFGVYPVKEIIKDGKVIKKDKYCYCYSNISGFKIYQPLSKFKWFSQGTLGIYPSNTLKEDSEYVIICSSVKDAMVIKELSYHSVCFDSETLSISRAKSYLEFLKSKFKRIYVLFDNDSTGYKSSSKLESLGAINLTPHFFINTTLKDVAQMKEYKLNIFKSLKRAFKKARR